MKYLFLILSVLIVDQLSKEIFRYFIESDTFIVFSYLNLISVWNKGVSFGMLNWLPQADLILFCSSIAISIILLYCMKKTRDRIARFSFAMIIGGAVGNAIDRLRFGAVYDFIDFHISNWHWPAFNVADISILIGGIMLSYRWYNLDHRNVRKKIKYKNKQLHKKI